VEKAGWVPQDVAEKSAIKPPQLYRYRHLADTDSGGMGPITVPRASQDSQTILAYGACARSASGSENRVFLRHHPSS